MKGEEWCLLECRYGNYRYRKFIRPRIVVIFTSGFVRRVGPCTCLELLRWYTGELEKHYQIISKLSVLLKTIVYNQFVLPGMTYGEETWRLTNKLESKFWSAQGAMQRTKTGVTLATRKKGTESWSKLAWKVSHFR